MKQFILLLGILISFRTYAGGGTVGNGGDSYVMDFIATGERVAKWLEAERINELSGLNAESFAKTLKMAKISSVEAPLILDGIEKDAINIPSTREIALNRSRWKSINNDFRKVGLVIHEVLGLMKINDEGYKISIPISSRITGVDPKKTPFFKVNYTCESTALAIKANGTELRDVQRAVVGYNPSAIGIQDLIHNIDGHTYYMGADIVAGSGIDESDLKSEYWAVEYYWLASPIRDLKALGTSTFYAVGNELPPKLILPFSQEFAPDTQTKISFKLTCKRN